VETRQHLQLRYEALMAEKAVNSEG
jgi:hypothetical protein